MRKLWVSQNTSQNTLPGEWPTKTVVNRRSLAFVVDLLQLCVNLKTN